MRTNFCGELNKKFIGKDISVDGSIEEETMEE